MVRTSPGFRIVAVCAALALGAPAAKAVRPGDAPDPNSGNGGGAASSTSTEGSEQSDQKTPEADVKDGGAQSKQGQEAASGSSRDNRPPQARPADPSERNGAIPTAATRERNAPNDRRRFATLLDSDTRIDTDLSRRRSLAETSNPKYSEFVTNQASVLSAANRVLNAYRAISSANKLISAVHAVAALPLEAGRPVGAAPAILAHSLIEIHRENAILQATENRTKAFVSPFLDRNEKLKQAIELASTAAQNFDSENKIELNQFVNSATVHQVSLESLVKTTAHDFPHSLASAIVGEVSFGAGQSGQNGAAFQMNFDFSSGKSDPLKEKNARFKEEPPGVIKNDAGLGYFGVLTGSAESEYPGVAQPMVSARAVSTARLAARLGIAGLVVHTELASVTDQRGVKHFGIIMENARGKEALGKSWRPVDPNDQDVQNYNTVHNNFKAAVAALDKAVADKQDAKSIQAAKVKVNENAYSVEKAEGLIRYNPSDKRWERSDLTRNVSDDTLMHPTFRQALANAELLDHICGQLDRHMGNLFVDGKDGNVDVKLIDNDLAFAPNDLNGKGTQRKPLPIVVDKKMRESILSVTHEQINDDLSGLLTSEELKAVYIRLDNVKNYLKTLTGANIATIEGAATGGEFLSWTNTPAELLFNFSHGRVANSYYEEISQQKPPS